jgi:hypothetical protein
MRPVTAVKDCMGLIEGRPSVDVSRPVSRNQKPLRILRITRWLTAYFIAHCRHYLFVNVVRCVITHRHFPSRLTKTSVALSRVLNSRSMYFSLLEVRAVTMAVVP